MRRIVLMLLLLCILPVSVQALEITAPPVPEAGEALMPEQTDSFGEGLLELLRKARQTLQPDLVHAVRIAVAVIAAVLMVTLVQSISGTAASLSEFIGTAAVGAALLGSADSMICLGAETVTQISEYGKLLLPVMTTALAAQGGVTASAAIYAGTAVFNTLLTGLISGLLVPAVYLFLALAAANSATGEEVLKRMRDLVKNAVSWCLKTVLTVFTTYMGITGVVSGTTDAVTLKATKMTISSVVPVVGGILSDASEAVLVSAGLVRNAAGVYGILAILAVFLAPFLQIGIHYLILKATAAVCSVFGTKRVTELIGDFSGAMGLLLAMTGASCLLLLISTICFMKGVG